MRNNLAFNGVSTIVEDVGEGIKTNMTMWIKVKFDIRVYTIEEFKIFLDGIYKIEIVRSSLRFSEV